eukprot:498095-Rhodomonas_salina.1
MLNSVWVPSSAAHAHTPRSARRALMRGTTPVCARRRESTERAEEVAGECDFHAAILGAVPAFALPPATRVSLAAGNEATASRNGGATCINGSAARVNGSAACINGSDARINGNSARKSGSRPAPCTGAARSSWP